jgi:hypothetical protein
MAMAICQAMLPTPKPSPGITYLVAGGHPLALGDKGGSLLVDLGLGSGNLVLKEKRQIISTARVGREEW